MLPHDKAATHAPHRFKRAALRPCQTKANEVLDAAEAGKGCAPADAKCVMVEGKCIPLDKIKAEEAEEPEASLARQVFAEALGTMFLVAVIVGSGYHGDILSPDDGVALLGNTLATWGILYVLISVLGGISGAHFNPVVSCCFWLKRELSSLKFALFVPFQIGGAILGSHVAHAMFQKKIYYFDGKDRDSWGEFFSEALTTLGLLLTIFGGIKAKGDVPMLVGLFITAGYWFSSSTSFANPAVTIGFILHGHVRVDHARPGRPSWAARPSAWSWGCPCASGSSGQAGEGRACWCW